MILRWLVCALFFSSLPALWAQAPIRLLNEAEAAILRGQPDQALTSIGFWMSSSRERLRGRAGGKNWIEPGRSSQV